MLKLFRIHAPNTKNQSKDINERRNRWAALILSDLQSIYPSISPILTSHQSISQPDQQITLHHGKSYVAIEKNGSCAFTKPINGDLIQHDCQQTAITQAKDDKMVEPWIQWMIAESASGAFKTGYLGFIVLPERPKIITNLACLSPIDNVTQNNQQQIAYMIKNLLEADIRTNNLILHKLISKSLISFKRASQSVAEKIWARQRPNSSEEIYRPKVTKSDKYTYEKQSEPGFSWLIPKISIIIDWLINSLYQIFRKYISKIINSICKLLAAQSSWICLTALILWLLHDRTIKKEKPGKHVISDTIPHKKNWTQRKHQRSHDTIGVIVRSQAMKIFRTIF